MSRNVFYQEPTKEQLQLLTPDHTLTVVVFFYILDLIFFFFLDKPLNLVDNFRVLCEVHRDTLTAHNHKYSTGQLYCDNKAILKLWFCCRCFWYTDYKNTTNTRTCDWDIPGFVSSMWCLLVTWLWILKSISHPLTFEKILTSTSYLSNVLLSRTYNSRFCSPWPKEKPKQRERV